MKIKAIIFDVDDTLISTSEFAFINMNKAAEILRLDKISKDKFLKHWGHTTEKMVRSHWPELDFKDFREAYEKLKFEGHYPILEGTWETLEFLKNKPIVLGILTSRTSDSLPKRFKQINLSLDYFKFIQYADDTDFHKPDPKVFEPILKRFSDIGIKRNDILYIGDHIYDARAALGNNLKFLGVLSGTTEKIRFMEEGVKEENIISSVKDFKEWFNKNIKL